MRKLTFYTILLGAAFAAPLLSSQESSSVCFQMDLDKNLSDSEKLVWSKAFIFQGLHMLANEKDPKYKEDKQKILKNVAEAILELKNKE